MLKVECHGQAMQAELEAEQQTPLIDNRRTPSQFKVPPPLPAMHEPDIYVLHPDAIQTNTRKNYLRDQMPAALVYILEYAETRRMMTENRYRNEDLLVHLRAVFGQVDRIRDHIDRALQQDDAHRRKRDMRFLLLPTRFPRPESMGQGDITVWTNWIREETETVINQLEEERDARGDPDDPFNGTANGIFQHLQSDLALALPPPVQTSRRQENGSELSESSRKLPRSGQATTAGTNREKNETNDQTQGESHELSEHLLESLDHMRSIRNLHTQQRQNRLQNYEPHQNPLSTSTVNPQEPNLITFTPPPGQHGVQGATGTQSEPKKQRSPRRRKARNEWQLNQRQFDQNKTQEISHISPKEQVNVFNVEEPSASYLQLPTKKVQQGDNCFCTRCGEKGHWRRYCQATTWCRFCTSETHATQACRKYERFVRDNPIASSRRMTPVQDQ